MCSRVYIFLYRCGSTYDLPETLYKACQFWDHVYWFPRSWFKGQGSVFVEVCPGRTFPRCEAMPSVLASLITSKSCVHGKWPPLTLAEHRFSIFQFLSQRSDFTVELNTRWTLWVLILSFNFVPAVICIFPLHESFLSKHHCYNVHLYILIFFQFYSISILLWQCIMMSTVVKLGILIEHIICQIWNTYSKYLKGKKSNVHVLLYRIGVNPPLNLRNILVHV